MRVLITPAWPGLSLSTALHPYPTTAVIWVLSLGLSLAQDRERPAEKTCPVGRQGLTHPCFCTHLLPASTLTQPSSIQVTWVGACICPLSPPPSPVLWSRGLQPLWHQGPVWWGLPRWLRGKESACPYRRQGFNPRMGKIPWRRKWQPIPVFLPRKPHGQRILVGYSPWSLKVGHN